MKILIVSNMYPSQNDPTYGTFVESFVKEISARNTNGVTDKIVIKGRSKFLITKIVKYIKFYLLTFFRPLFFRYDIIYVHFLTFSPITLNLLCRFKNLPLVINVHGGDILTRSNFAERLKQFNRPLLRKSKMIVSPSRYFKKVLITEFPELDSDKIYVSPSGGVNTTRFTLNDNKPKDFYRIGYVSRIDEGKGWDIFIRSVKYAKDLGYNIKADIVGRGSQIHLLNRMLNEYHLEDDIHYHGGVPYSNLPSIYSSFDLFVFATQLPESLGLVAIEAMACGVPVVGAKIGGLQDYIQDGVNGFFVKGRRYEDYFEGIKRYIELADYEKSRMRQQARTTSLEYDSNEVFNDLYRQLEMLK